jgi:hypothetical protein
MASDDLRPVVGAPWRGCWTALQYYLRDRDFGPNAPTTSLVHRVWPEASYPPLGT